MSKIIYKFKLEPEDEQFIELPFGATFLKAGKQVSLRSMGQQQAEDIMLWFLCNADATKYKRRVVVVPTGIKFVEDGLVYLDTVFLNNGNLVFHIFIERV